MPINSIIAERDSGGGITKPEESDLPDADPEIKENPPETTLVTRTMMPPYIHNQTVGQRSVLALVSTGIGMIWMLNLATEGAEIHAN